MSPLSNGTEVCLYAILSGGTGDRPRRKGRHSLGFGHGARGVQPFFAVDRKRCWYFDGGTPILAMKVRRSASELPNPERSAASVTL